MHKDVAAGIYYLLLAMAICLIVATCHLVERDEKPQHYNREPSSQRGLGDVKEEELNSSTWKGGYYDAEANGNN